ncbi:MAG TPA: class I SAM-dependent methyltransferase [Thermoleophilaceae bacterium]|nr:class I SAM-dependent methyltransferase [Thermoleophilaceae bacterium]
MAQADASDALAGRSLPEALREELSELNATIPVDEGGGASALKVLVIADAIAANDLERVVEIGVYRGRLLLPLGLLMRRLGRGEAIGIDPYSATAAAQSDPHGRSIDLAAWAAGVDWNGIHEDVLMRIEALGLDRHCRIVRKRSEEAAPDFSAASIDVLHVDGNHDRAAVERDVALYLPKVRPGGFVVMDDAAWPSIRPVCARLADEHQMVLQLYDGSGVLDGVGGNDFAIFQLTGG